MNKPKKQARYAYNWDELTAWVTHKTGRDVRDWSGKLTDETRSETAPYQDMWRWVLEVREIHNGCYFFLDLNELDFRPEYEFVREILAILRADFGDEITCYVEW
jgi:hypothetical protein